MGIPVAYVPPNWIKAQLWNEGEIFIEEDTPRFVDFDALIRLSETKETLTTSSTPAAAEILPLGGRHIHQVYVAPREAKSPLRLALKMRA
jgi:hypothetical protein